MAASVPPNVQERILVGECPTFGGTEAAATIAYWDRFLDLKYRYWMRKIERKFSSKIAMIPWHRCQKSSRL